LDLKKSQCLQGCSGVAAFLNPLLRLGFWTPYVSSPIYYLLSSGVNPHGDGVPLA